MIILSFEFLSLDVQKIESKIYLHLINTPIPCRKRLHQYSVVQMCFLYFGLLIHNVLVIWVHIYQSTTLMEMETKCRCQCFNIFNLMMSNIVAMTFLLPLAYWIPFTFTAAFWWTTGYYFREISTFFVILLGMWRLSLLRCFKLPRLKLINSSSR